MSASDRVAEYHGWWWLPSAPEVRVGGVLRMAPGEPGTLRVYGGLVDFDRPRQEVVLGDLADGGKVTICHASIRQQKGWRTPTLQELDTYETLIGGHFHDPRSALFKRVSLESRWLRAWMPLPHARAVPAHEGGEPRTLDVSQVDPLTAQVPDLGAVTLACDESQSFGPGRLSLEFVPRWHLALDEPMTLDDLWSRFVAPILFLMTLVTGERESVVKLELRSTEDEAPRAVEWHDTGWLGRRAVAERPHLRSPFITYEMFAARFGQAVPAWFHVDGKAQDVMITYFSGQMVDGRFADDRFSNTVRALEAWHRSHDPAPYAEEEIYKTLVGSVIDVLPEEHRLHFRERLSHANEISLKKRVEAMIQMAGPGISHEIDRFEKFAQRVVATRNAQAHRAELGDFFEPHELVTASFLLEAVFEGVIARQIGFSDVDLTETELNTVRWANIRSGPMRAA